MNMMRHDFAAEHFPGWRGREPVEPHRATVAAALHAAYPERETAPSFAAMESAWPDAPVHRYNHPPAAARALLDGVAPDLRAPWLCAWMVDLIGRFDAHFAATGLAGEFALHYADHFHRILDQIAADPSFADLASDSFCKDLWLTRAVMIPAFAQLWWPRSGLSAKVVLRAGPRAAAHVFWRSGGRRPFFEGHTHDPVARAYWNAAGWAEALRLAALALPAFPAVRGVFGTAWFYDPAILTITPRLSFAQALQAGQGARQWPVGTNPDAIANATATSADRRARYEAGTYLPTDYAMVWARRDLLARYG